MKTLIQAIILLASGKLLFAIQDVIIKEMSSDYPITQIVAIRGMVAVPILLLLIHFSVKLSALLRHHPGIHILRGFLMFIAFLLFYVALSKMSLTTTTALFFTAPFFITLLARPMLGERFGLRRVSAMLVGFIGVLLVLRPDQDDFSLFSLLPIASAFFYAFCQLLVRYARLTAPASIMSLYASLAFVVLGPLAGLIFSTENLTQELFTNQAIQAVWSWPSSRDLLVLALTGITSAFGFMCSSKAYQHEEASRVAPFEYVMIIWVSLLSYLVWSEVPDLLTIGGIIIIVGSGIYVLQREKIKDPKPLAYTGLSRR